MKTTAVVLCLAARSAAQTAEASPWDAAAQAALASCASFSVSASLTVEQLTQTSARVQSSSWGNTFWITDNYGTVIALSSGSGTQTTLSWAASAAPAYLIGHLGCSTSTIGLETAPTPSWAQRLSDVQNAWDSRSSSSATALAPVLNVNYAAKTFSVVASTALGSAATDSVVGEQLVPLVWVRDGAGNILYLKEYTAASGTGVQPASDSLPFLPNATLLKACAIVGNANQCTEKDQTASAIAEITAQSTVSVRTDTAAYLTSSFSAGLGTLYLSPGPQCATASEYTLFSSSGGFAASSPLALAVDWGTSSETVYACCAELIISYIGNTARRRCGEELNQLTVQVASLMNAEALALSSLAAAADEAATNAALAGGSLLCDSTYTVGQQYVRPSSGAQCTCQCVQYHTEALLNCTLAAPSCVGGTAPPTPPSPPSDASIGTGGALAITFSGVLALGAIGMVGRQRWIEKNRAKAYNVQLSHGAA